MGGKPPSVWLSCEIDVSSWKLEVAVNTGRFSVLIRSATATALLFALTLSGCTLKQYAGQADKAAYGALARGQTTALGESEPFSVEYDPFCSAQDGTDCPIVVGDKEIPIGGDQPARLTLAECLEVAFRNSRDLQDRKEDLYEVALSLANTRRGWDIPLLGGDLDAEIGTSKTDAEPSASDASASVGPTLTQRLVGGGVITLASSVAWATNFLGEGTFADSLLEANFTQPLLRGAWRGLAYEDQYRLERDFLFEVYDYQRFREEFAADILGRYYNVLRQRDQLEIDSVSIENQKTTLAVTKVQVEGGLLSRVDEDRAEQAMLSAQVRYEQNQQQYSNAVDAFKILIGLPIEANVELDYPAALEDLAEVGPRPIGVSEEAAVAIALSARPDVLTERAGFRDADRDVEVAADDFLPQLDVEMGISAAGEEPRDFQKVRFDRNTRFARATFNYEIDQTDNRDNYRGAMIAYEQARRDLAEFLDEVTLEVRQAYRELIQSKQSYELQDRSVVIARRRHKLAQLQQKEGEASTEDVLDAEEDMRQAENGRTGALVSYNNTRIEFLASLGLISVDEEGRINDRTESFDFKRIAARYPYVAGE